MTTERFVVACVDTDDRIETLEGSDFETYTSKQTALADAAQFAKGIDNGVYNAITVYKLVPVAKIEVKKTFDVIDLEKSVE
jgi:hypothetical protein